MRRSLVLLCVSFVCGALMGERVTSAQRPAPPNEYDLKAGYFYYFGDLVKWPNPPFPGADNDFVIGVLGSNSFGQYLGPAGNGFAINSGLFKVPVTVIQGKKIKVVQYDSVAEFERNYQPCHILFISRNSTPGIFGETVLDRVNAALQKTKGQPVLLVGEANGKAESLAYARSGVIICYWNDLQARKLKMIINQTSALRERLDISARLLGLKIVTTL
ncbi:hypothetical protein Enr13x_16870 [Stieleria neptunia]|uniref:DUF4154 domain-containing protein n=1 Tax=Stieleria neptunia TaxID=2527979 RepID=A0A518HLW6_9BACT|nr:YfiR family protein [Stieleria neptunia]QDV41844.1 hypothetical protein Enr13x_16870 [Stieleria neptunia]